jgi:hypothetical protein
MALLFEDLFKKFIAEVKKHTDQVLSKPARAGPFNPGISEALFCILFTVCIFSWFT